MDTKTQHRDFWQSLSEVHGASLSDSDVERCDFMQEVSYRDTFVYHDNEPVRTPSKGALVRADGLVVGEGLGRGSYSVKQPSEVYAKGKELQALTDWPLVAAGSLRDGSQVFFTYRGEPVQVRGVPLDPHTSLVCSYDGSLPFTALHTVMCGGTPLGAPAFAHNDRTIIKNTINADERGLNLLDVVHQSLSHTTHCADLISSLLSVKLETRSAVDTLLPPIKGDTKAAALRATARTTIWEMVEVRGLGDQVTGWDFVQLVADYESWVAPVRVTNENQTSETTVRAVRQFDAVVRTKQALTQAAVQLAEASR